ncbi:MAG: hypothetical protein PF637_08940 [Spirochaetes bacterium]|jgi:hypothetical protein|nr:hypothetical protein [Spirochaetota bacterium]
MKQSGYLNRQKKSGQIIPELLTIKIILLALVLLNSTATILSDEPVFSGIVESNGTTYSTPYGGFTWNAEQFANIRMKAAVGSRGVIHAAVNTSASSAKEEELHTDAELERLYMSIRGEKIDIDAGYMRIPFGYGQGFKPSDLINPQNPLYPEARLQGALGTTIAFYHFEDYKYQIFAADRKNPYQQYSGYSRPLAGLSGDYHSSLFSIQALYALQQPVDRGSGVPVHYGGFSLKFDAIAGFALDTLYSHDGQNNPEYDGLQAAIGVDYSILKGDLYLMLQYLYNGDGYLDNDDDLSDLYGTDQWDQSPPEERVSVKGYSDLYRKHYLFFNTVYNISDFTRVSGIVLLNMEDFSLLPFIKSEHEPFQGLTLNLTVRIPVDQWLLTDGDKGELGPHHTGYNSAILFSAAMKF